jgi:hypothetical protein
VLASTCYVPTLDAIVAAVRSGRMDGLARVGGHRVTRSAAAAVDAYICALRAERVTRSSLRALNWTEVAQLGGVREEVAERAARAGDVRHDARAAADGDAELRCDARS